MRSYFKVYGPLDQSFVASFPQEGADKEYAMSWASPFNKPSKAAAINLYNDLAGVFTGRDKTMLVWYLIDTTTGTPPAGGEILEQFTAQQMAAGAFSLRAYSSHRKN